jgi:hypothetical protein
MLKDPFRAKTGMCRDVRTHRADRCEEQQQLRPLALTPDGSHDSRVGNGVTFTASVTEAAR